MHDQDTDESFCLEEIHTAQRDIADYTVANERLLDTIDAITLRNSKPFLAAEAFNAIRALSVSGTNLSFEDLILDNYTLEAVNNNKDHLIMQFFYNIKSSMTRFVDHAQYMYTLFNVQTSRLNRVKRAIASINGKSTYNVRVGNTKYTTYGNDERITDVKTYIDKFGDVTNIMSKFDTAINDLAQDDLFVSWRLLKELTLLNRKGIFKERFESLLKTMEDAKKATKLKLEASKPTYEIYASEIMLGLSQVVVQLPKKTSFREDDYESMFEATRHLYMYVDRVTKMRITTIFSGADRWEMTKKDAEAILKDAEILLQSLNTLLSITTRLSTAFGSAASGANWYREGDEDIDFVNMTRAGRIVNRTSALLYDSIGASYNFSMGNVKKALSICEGFASSAT